MASRPTVDTKRDPNLQVYNAHEVAAHYAGLDYLSPCEILLFENFLRSGMAILDLGVGGGRTTPYLSGIASRYVGVDYAQEMIASCQSKFPGLEFLVADAADLSAFEDSTFDAVVMAFNGMDYVIPDESRFRSLREIHRVVKQDGILIFSSHNPRAILVRPSWSAKRMEELARRLAGGSSLLASPVRLVLTGARAAKAFVASAVQSITRTIRRVPKRAFWHGDGYLVDSVHGGLVTHYAVPERVVAELVRFGYRLLRLQGDDYPQVSHPYITDWYYYVFAKTAVPTSRDTCA
jgi:ubiquinone/menaquinone biosynthesis C-methylase UbiE